MASTEKQKLNNRNYYRRNRERVLAGKKKWNKNNRSVCRKAFKRWREKHLESAKKATRESQARMRLLVPEKIAANGRRSKYNISDDWFNTKLQKQDGKCAICGKEEIGTYRGKQKSLAIDHDHSCCPDKKSCGKCVRGLLCGHCNRGLGMFLENIKSLESAIKYLKEYNNGSG